MDESDPERIWVAGNRVLKRLLEIRAENPGRIVVNE
jgi:hypothetical protein